MVESKAKLVEKDLVELESIFNEFHENGGLVQELKSNMVKGEQKSFQQLRKLENNINYGLMPEEIAEAIALCIDSLKKILKNEHGAFEELNESREYLANFIELSKSEKVAKWDKTVLEAISNYSGEHILAATDRGHVIDVGIRSFVENVIYNNTGLDDILPSSEIAKSLKKDYQRTAELTYGIERNSVSFTISGSNKQMVEEVAKKTILQQIDFKQYEKEVKRTNSNITDLLEAEIAIEEGEYPTYSDLDLNKADKLKNFVAQTMIECAEEALDTNISAHPDQIEMRVNEDVTGYMGKVSSKKWLIKFSSEKSEGSLFELMDKNPESYSFQQLLRFIDETPTGYISTDQEHTPSRAPDVFMVDLVHEIGHVVSNMAAEAVFFQQPVENSYQSLVNDKIGNRKSEEAANEIAGLTLKKLSGNLGGAAWKHIFKGFESYLEMSKYDSDAKGYRSQHPIYGNEDKVRSLYET